MSTKQRKIAAFFVIAALGAAAVALMAGSSPVSAFLAEVAGIEDSRAAERSALSSGDPPSVSLADPQNWEPADGDDPDQAAWADPAVRPLRVRVVGKDDLPAAGVPVVVLARDDRGAPLAGPKYTNADGRVRFPIDPAMERGQEIIVAARACPGHASMATVQVAVDQAADVALVVETGVRGLVHAVDPEGRLIAAGARVRKAILGDPVPESGPRGEVLAAVFGETTCRGIRTSAGFELVGLCAPEDFTLVVAAAGFAPVYQQVHVPLGARAPFLIDVKLEKRTSLARFEAVPPVDFAREAAQFSCHRIEGEGIVLAAGIDDVPAQKSTVFDLEVAPNDAQRIEVCGWLDGAVVASADVDVPALREGEVFDAGTIRLESLPVVLSGRVVDQDQGPLANATIEAIGRGRTRDLATITACDGAFFLRAPAGRGPYQVSAHAKGRVSERLAGVVEPARDLRFVLEQSGAIQGNVIPPAGVDPDRISVRAIVDGRSPFATSPKSGGTFVLSGLPRGVYTVVIDGDDVEQVRITDLVVAPPEITRDGRLERIRLRSRSGQGQP